MSDIAEVHCFLLRQHCSPSCLRLIQDVLMANTCFETLLTEMVLTFKYGSIPRNVHLVATVIPQLSMVSESIWNCASVKESSPVSCCPVQGRKA